MNYKYLSLIFISLLYVLTASAQVKIGATTAPHPFSALELESIEKGVRMPQMSTINKTNLTSKILANPNKALAGGLVLYNSIDDTMEMWQEFSEKWIALPSNLQCTAPTSISISAISATTILEYSKDLKLEAIATGESANAALYYEWYKDDVQIGRGKTFTVEADRLTYTYAGQYTVKVISCYNQNLTNVVTSTPITITITE